MPFVIFFNYNFIVKIREDEWSFKCLKDSINCRDINETFHKNVKVCIVRL